MYGLGAAPTIDCENLREPELSDLRVVIDGPFNLTGTGARDIEVRLVNTGVVPLYLWGLTLPLEFDISGGDVQGFDLTLGEVDSTAGWTVRANSIDQSRLVIDLFPDFSGSAAARELAPGATYTLFTLTVDYAIQDLSLITPHLTVVPPTAAPYAAVGESESGAVATEILSLELDHCCGPLGDANYDGRFNIADVTYVLQFIFGDLNQLACEIGGDMNLDLQVNISDVTTGISYIFVESPSLACRSCPLGPYISDLIDETGDLNLNGIGFEIADVVLFERYLLEGVSALIVDPPRQLLAADADFDCNPATIGDLGIMIGVAVGDLNPPIGPYPVEHFAQGATVTYSASSGLISLDSPARAVLLFFPGVPAISAVAGGPTYGTASVDGYTRLVFSHLSFSGEPSLFSGDIAIADRAPLFAEAVDSLGAMYNVTIVTTGP